MLELARKAWLLYETTAVADYVVRPAIPILFFGDVDKYRISKLRVITVGLNPSRKEFPVNGWCSRFPAAAHLTNPGNAADLRQYLRALGAYFREDPYSRWFKSFETVLSGMEASYYDGASYTAIHTDLCSPLATDPTWSGLNPAHQVTLRAAGIPLGMTLLIFLPPISC